MVSTRREVVITGLGLTTPLGVGVAENWEGVKALKTGIGYYPVPGVPKSLCYLGKVKELEAERDVPQKLLGQMKFLNRGSLLGYVAAREAISDAKMHLTEISPAKRALYIASGDTTSVGYDFMYPAVKDGTHGKWQEMDTVTLNRSTVDKVNPFFLLKSICNNLFSFLSACYEFMGSNATLASHSPHGGNALELASRSIQQGQADIALAVGCGNSITEIPRYEMEGLGVLSHCREGVQSYRPFDRRRDGLIPGEGGAAVLLEAAEVAERRGARILGRIRGFGNGIEFSKDQSLTVPPRVTSQCMRSALEGAATDLRDLSLLCPHGSGSKKGDQSELASIQDLGEERSTDVPITGLKAYTGHLGAASDLAEVIFCLRSMGEGMIPATLHFREAEQGFSDLRISGKHERCERGLFLSVSYGIGGQSSAVVIEVP